MNWLLATLIWWLSSPWFAWSELRLNGVFRDHMVLQQPVPELGITSTRIYGMALLNETVHIHGSDGFPGPFITIPQKTHHSEGDYGNFSIEITPNMSHKSYPGPYTIRIQTQMIHQDAVIMSRTILKDIYFGDVILCSGQSNMESSVDECDNSQYEKLQANDLPNIRLFVSKRTYSIDVVQNIATQDDKGWMIASHESISAFSCICWINGRLIAKWLENKLGKTPYLGLMESVVSDSSIHFWSPANIGIACNVTGDHYCEWIPPQFHGVPALCFNAMINPISLYQEGLSIRSVIWYQGESDHEVMSQESYECELNGLINGWREHFGNEKLPFIIIQLPSLEEFYCEIQAAQFVVSEQNENVGLVVSEDQGLDILRYTDKHTVAERISYWMRHLSYNDLTINAQGPVYESTYRLGEDDMNIFIKFSNFGAGLRLQASASCRYYEPRTIWTDSNHTYRCCEMNGVNVVRVKVSGIYWEEIDGHWKTVSFSWIPTNITIVRHDAIMVTPILPNIENKRIASMDMSMLTIGNSESCVLANSYGIPTAASQGPYDIDIMDDMELLENVNFLSLLLGSKDDIYREDGMKEGVRLDKDQLFQIYVVLVLCFVSVFALCCVCKNRIKERAHYRRLLSPRRH